MKMVIRDEMVQLDLAEIQKKCQDLRPFFEAAGAYMMASVGRNFAEETEPSGKPWTPLAESTLQGRRKGGRGAKILQDTGQHIRDTMGADATADRVRIGPATKIIPQVHQYGTTRAGRGNKTTIPARPFLGFRPEDPEAIERLACDHLEGKLGMGGVNAGAEPLI